MSHPVPSPRPIRAGDPTWLKVLRAVALVLGIVLMAIALYGVWRFYETLQRVQETLQGPPANTLELDLPEVPDSDPILPGEGQTTEDYWTTDPDGEGPLGPEYCYVTPDGLETICEPIE